MPLVSIILSVYNAENSSRRAIDSVSAQSFSDWELIIVNDGSTDKTAEIITNAQTQDSRVICVTHEKI